MITFFEVTLDYEITEVGGSWDRFARENGALEVVRENVLGTKLLRHISGSAQKMWMEAVIMAVRNQMMVARMSRSNPVSPNNAETRRYRCDSEEARRLMEMTVYPISNDRLRAEHVLLKEERMPNRVFIAPAIDSEIARRRCGVCNRVELDAEWLDPFTLGRDSLHEVTYDICHQCVAGETALEFR